MRNFLFTAVSIFLFLGINASAQEQNDCYQGDNPDWMGPGRNITNGSNFRATDDFLVSSENDLGVNAVEFYIMSHTPITNADLYFYNDNESSPDTASAPKYELANLTPTYQIIVGVNGATPVYRVIFNLEEELVFEGDEEGTRYWMELKATNQEGTNLFWYMSRSGSLGVPLYYSSDGGSNWNTYSGELRFHAVFKISCTNIEEPVQDPYCIPSFGNDTEPITFVSFNEIENRTSSTVDGSGVIEYFLDQVANVNQSQTYELTVEGNTAGEYTSYIIAFVDWNQNGILDDEGEIYTVGVIFNSNGEDDQQAKLEITIPDDALLGNTRMRILKNWLFEVTNPCNTYLWGQAEDYTINVQESILPECEMECPEDIVVQAEEGQNTAAVTYVIEYDCDDSEGVELVLAAGYASGQDFPVGTTTVTHNLVYEGTVIDTCSFDVTVEEYLGVSDLTNSHLSFYPNPVIDVLNISYDKVITHISVYDLSGKQLYAKDTNNKQTEINLSQLPSGVYIVKTEMAGEVRSFKIVKK